MGLQDDVLYAEQQVSKVLRCEVRTLQAWRWRGSGPTFMKIGRLVRYRGDDVKAWMESRRKKSTSQNLPQDAA